MTRYGSGYDPDHYGGARFYRGYGIDARDRRVAGGPGRYGTMRGYDMEGAFGGRRSRPRAPRPRYGGLYRDAPDWSRLHWSRLPPRH